ncbi:hypothetical protein ACJ6WD_11210 [Streptomyces sp. VTCC 41912]|uniref:hypothetical protein n=1 Tax=Streptomyces TaxID=1883 RepID=UPI00344D8478
MGLPTQRSLNRDLHSGLDDGRSRHPNPNWGGAALNDRDVNLTWTALQGCSPVQGLRNTAPGY